MDLYSPRLSWEWILLTTQICQQQRLTLSPFLWHHSLRSSASYWGLRLIGYLYWTASLMVGVGSIYWNRHAGYRFAFPLCNVSSKAALHGVTECLIYRHGIPHNSASDKGTVFAANEVYHWVNGIHLFYHVPQHHEAAGLIELWNGLLKTQLQCQLGPLPYGAGARFPKRPYMF